MRHQSMKTSDVEDGGPGKYAIHWYMEYDADNYLHALAQALIDLSNVLRGEDNTPKTFVVENMDTEWRALVDADGYIEQR